MTVETESETSSSAPTSTCVSDWDDSTATGSAEEDRPFDITETAKTKDGDVDDHVEVTQPDNEDTGADTDLPSGLFISVDRDDFEASEDFRKRLIFWIAQMMFVSGETAEPSAETTWMIEEIVREQVVEMASILRFQRAQLF